VADALGAANGGRIRINTRFVTNTQDLKVRRAKSNANIKADNVLAAQDIPKLEKRIEVLLQQRQAGHWGDKDSYGYFAKNDDLRLTRKTLKKRKLDLNRTEFVVDGVEPIYDVAIHETAHIFQWRYPGWNGGKPVNGYADADLIGLLGGPKKYKGNLVDARPKISPANKPDVLRLSQYAETETSETLAEAMVAYTANRTDIMTAGMIEAVKDVLKQVPKWETGMGPTARWAAGK
jgi:hypothetical protein